jgi:ribosome-binding protein aMBF1 (putative translation factor)
LHRKGTQKRETTRKREREREERNTTDEEERSARRYAAIKMRIRGPAALSRSDLAEPALYRGVRRKPSARGFRETTIKAR